MRTALHGALVVVVLCTTPSLAQSLAASHQRDLAATPGDLHLRLGTAGNSGGFHRGERIPLALEFWSDTPAKYKLDGATYDRSGRLPTEEFVVERKDVVDPYADYFFTGVLGGIAGGLRSNPVLDEKPYRIELDLNDWFRFDQPGTYRLYLKSHRVSRERAPQSTEGESRTIQLAAVSNILEVVIIPDDTGWTAQKVRDIEALLVQPEPEMPIPGGPPVAVNPLEEQLRNARRDLRYLATNDALDLIMNDARRRGNSPDTLALIGVRDRNKAIAAYDNYLGDRMTPINEWDIRVRALLRYVQKESPKPLPVFSWQMTESWDFQRTMTEAQSRQKQFEKFVHAEAVRLIPIAATKEKAARVESGKAIAAIAPIEAKAARLVPPDNYGLAKEELIAQFASFPEEQQAELLGHKWDLIRGPGMISVLRTVISRSGPGTLPKNTMPLQVRGISNGVGEGALRRLRELAPKEAFRIIADDLVRGDLRFAHFAALELPAQGIPEADATFSRWLAGGEPGVLPLIARFATEKLAGDMQKLYLSESWPCDDEALFLTYFIRVLPQSGPGSAGEFLRQALANRKDRGCHHFLIGQLAGVVWKPALEAIAIQSLDDPDTETAISAARALGGFGAAAVEPYLWTRLKKWSEKWRGRSAELEQHPITGTLPVAEGNLGRALFQAIASAKSWLLDESRRQKLAALCIDNDCRKEWAQDRPGPGKWNIDVSNGGAFYPVAFRVGGYGASTFEALKEKLTQYPSGTAFRWCPQAFNPSDAFSPGQREEMYQDLVHTLAARSITIEPYDYGRCFGQGAK